MIVNRLLSWALIAYMAVTCILFYFIALAIWLVTRPFDRRLRLLHLFTCFWGYMYVWLVPMWHVTKLAREKIDRKKTYVVVSNHQSQLDILVAFGLFFHYKWVSKVEIFKLPFIGWNMILNDYVKLVRGDKESVRLMLDHCRRTLGQGNSVWIFPEGSRSKDGTLRQFKPGAFILAKELGLPILPVAISGTCHALPKKSMVMRGHNDITIQVLDEIPPAAFDGLSVEQTAEMVREVIGAHVREHIANTSGEMARAQNQ